MVGPSIVAALLLFCCIERAVSAPPTPTPPSKWRTPVLYELSASARWINAVIRPNFLNDINILEFYYVYSILIDNRHPVERSLPKLYLIIEASSLLHEYRLLLTPAARQEFVRVTLLGICYAEMSAIRQEPSRWQQTGHHNVSKHFFSPMDENWYRKKYAVLITELGTICKKMQETVDHEEDERIKAGAFVTRVDVIPPSGVEPERLHMYVRDAQRPDVGVFTEFAATNGTLIVDLGRLVDVVN